MRTATSIMTVVAALLASEAAFAQTSGNDVVVIRRVLAPPKPKPVVVIGTPTPTVPEGYYSWKTSAWEQEGQCGQLGVQRRDAWCERTDGVKVDDVNCHGGGSGYKPLRSMGVIVTDTCAQRWQTGEWSAEHPHCGKYNLTRSVRCVRTDGTTLPSDRCGLEGPETTMQVEDYSTCAFQWFAGEWSELKDFCGDVTRRRAVYCRRTDGSQADATMCAGSGEMPVSATTMNFPACQPNGTPTPGPGWVTSEWDRVATGSCGEFEVTRTAQCVNEKGEILPASRCGDRPALTRTVEALSGCTYKWTAGPYSEMPKGCGTVESRRTTGCLRSDGAWVLSSNCSGPAPQDRITGENYDACTNGWQAGEWSSWSTECGDATRTRSVTCRRTDGLLMPDGSCPDERPSSTGPTPSAPMVRPR